MLVGLSLGELKTTPPASTTGLITDWSVKAGKSRLLAEGKSLTVWITIKCGKF